MTRPRYSGTFPADADAVSRVRTAVAKIATQCGLSPAELVNVRIAVSEIVTNVVVHAYADRTGEIRVTIHCDGDDFEVVIADDGPGMAPRLGSPGMGLGLPTAATAARDLKVLTPEAGGTEVHLTFRCEPEPDAA